jgi:hypothetical protein
VRLLHYGKASPNRLKALSELVEETWTTKISNDAEREFFDHLKPKSKPHLDILG